MISIICSSQNPDNNFKKHILDTCGLKNVEFIFYENKNKYSLTEIYNKALIDTKYDIVVFLHHDIELMTKNWGNKLLKHYKRNPEFGVLGVAGSKYLPDTGKWWEKKRMMYGQVYHTHQGKTWLSKYSEHLGNKITETVIVDGVFFSAHKNRIKKDFNEDVKGFHFYDVDFSFRNHIEGVKVGVHFDIKINHMSIGQTNDEWEKNRIQFVEDNRENLPVKVYEDFTQRKLKVLIGLLNFQGLTGSEVSTLETVKILSKTCDVSVISNVVGDKYAQICKMYGVKTFKMSEPPGFKVGDGKWGFNNPEGFKVSQLNMVYKIEDIKFDIIHANHTPITEQLLKLYPESSFVNIVRSEVIDLENPIIDERIKRYIAIRPSIKDYMVESFDIPEEKIDIVYNAFDSKRFKINDKLSGTNKKVTLFVGSMDYLRKNVIEDLVKKCNLENKELWLVGRDSDKWASELADDWGHVKYFPPTEKIEEFYYKCDETAGIFLGRTTIEGFLCGKPAITYKVDKMGNIIDWNYHQVPVDLNIFDLNVHVENIKRIYIKTYNII